MNQINKKLFDDIEARLEKDTGTSLWGISHPLNVLINLQDDIIEGYELITKLHQKKQESKDIIAEIDKILRSSDAKV